jgi:hypothetical protein
MGVVNKMDITQPDETYNSWPVIIKAKNNDLLVFYSKGLYHGTTDTTRKVVYKRSTDYGVTWSEETTLSDDEYDNSVFGAGVTSSGAIIVVIRKNLYAGETSLDNGVIRSIDNGATWSEYSSISFEVNPVMIGPMINVPGKGLMMGWHNATWSSGVIWSYDDGLTWSAPQVIASNTDNAYVPVETRFAYLGFGKIIGIGRTQINGNPLFQLQSEDYGQTWKVYNTNITDQIITPAAIVFDNGVIDICYYHRGEGALRHRKADIEKIWYDSQSWPESEIIAEGSLSIADAGYAHSVQITNNLCMCVYYSGDSTNTGIYGTYFLSGLTQDEFITSTSFCTILPLNLMWNPNTFNPSAFHANKDSAFYIKIN